MDMEQDGVQHPKHRHDILTHIRIMGVYVI